MRIKKFILTSLILQQNAQNLIKFRDNTIRRELQALECKVESKIGPDYGTGTRGTGPRSPNLGGSRSSKVIILILM